MPANTDPVFTLTPNIGHARLAAANTASDGSGTTPTLFTAGANGSLVERIRYANSQATAAASSAMVVRVFCTDNGGINPRLVAEFVVSGATRSTTVAGASGVYEFPAGLKIPTGSLLLIIQSVYAGAQDQMDYTCEGGDY
jgi:hypothetical protein